MTDFDYSKIAKPLEAFNDSSLISPATSKPKVNVPSPRPVSDLPSLIKFARGRGFKVTSTTGGRHNVGSAHYAGRAIDVRTRDKSPDEVARLMEEAQSTGLKVRDERVRPRGQKVWGGAHLHLEVGGRPTVKESKPFDYASIAKPLDAVTDTINVLPADAPLRFASSPRGSNKYESQAIKRGTPQYDALIERLGSEDVFTANGGIVIDATEKATPALTVSEPEVGRDDRRGKNYVAPRVSKAELERLIM